MSIETVGASNFYYYGKLSSKIPNPTFPPGQEITTLLPANIVAIRIGAIFILTLCTAYTIARIPVLTILRWPVIILGITLSAYIAYKHLLIKDPLVEAFYKIAGGKDNYDKLPEIKLDASKKTCDNFNISWDALEHPVYRFITTDGRKGLLVKGLSNSAELGLCGEALTQATIIFVEKLGPYDRRSRISNLAEWGESIFTALTYKEWDNPFSTNSSSSSRRNFTAPSKTAVGIFASMFTDNANEFIAQRGIVNHLEPKVEEVNDDSL